MVEKRRKVIRLVGIHVLGLMVIVSLFYMFNSKYGGDLETVDKELTGYRYAEELHMLSSVIQKIRGLSQLYGMVPDKNNEKNAQEHMENLKKEAHKSLYRLARIEQDGEKEFTESLQALTLKIGTALSECPQEPERAFKHCSELITEINEFYMYLGDHFKLLFDPERQSYFAITLVVWRIPLMLEDIDGSRGIGSRLMVKKSYTDEEVYRLLHFRQDYQEALLEIKNVLSLLAPQGKIDKSEHIYNLLDSVEKVQDSCDALAESIASNILTGAFSITGKEFFDIATNAVNAVNDFRVDASRLLVQSLENRKSLLRKDIYYTTVLFVVIMVGVLAGFIFSFLDINKKVRRKKRVAALQKIKTELIESVTLKEACDIGLSGICVELPALKGVLYLFNERNKKLYLGATYAQDPERYGMVLRISETIIGQVAKDHQKHHRPLEKKDLSADLESLGMTSCSVLTVPLIHEGMLVAVVQLVVDKKVLGKRLEYLDALCEIMAVQVHQKIIYEENNKIMVLVDEKIITSQTNEKGVIASVSQAFADISGYTKEELIGKHHNVVRHPDMPKEIFKELWNTIKEGRRWHGEIKNRTKEGGYYWVDTTISPNTDFFGNIIGYTAMRLDITNKKRIEELSVRDSLTGLHNRRYFDEKFEEMLKFAKREKRRMVFGMMDVDYFKKYNDTYGHQLGDEALKSVAGVLKNIMKRPGDGTFRLGGEEFGILFFSDDDQHALDFADSIRESIEALHITHVNNSASAYVTMSIGLCIIDPEGESDHDELYKRADEALYRAKEGGRNRVSV